MPLISIPIADLNNEQCKIGDVYKLSFSLKNPDSLLSSIKEKFIEQCGGHCNHI